MDSQDQRKISPLSGHDGHGAHHCSKCGWPFPNPHPSAKHRRAHKRNCGKIEGYKIMDSKEPPSDDEHPSDEDCRTPSPKVVERSGSGNGSSGIGERSNRSEDEVFADAAAEFTETGLSPRSQGPLKNASISFTKAEAVNDSHAIDPEVTQGPKDLADGNQMQNNASKDELSAGLSPGSVFGLDSDLASSDYTASDLVESKQEMLSPEAPIAASIGVDDDASCFSIHNELETDVKGNQESDCTLRDNNLHQNCVPNLTVNSIGTLCSDSGDVNSAAEHIDGCSPEHNLVTCETPDCASERNRDFNTGDNMAYIGLESNAEGDEEVSRTSLESAAAPNESSMENDNLKERDGKFSHPADRTMMSKEDESNDLGPKPFAAVHLFEAESLQQKYAEGNDGLVQDVIKENVELNNAHVLSVPDDITIKDDPETMLEDFKDHNSVTEGLVTLDLGIAARVEDETKASFPEVSLGSAKSNSFGETMCRSEVGASATDHMLDKGVEEIKPVSENSCVVTASGRSTETFQENITDSVKPNGFGVTVASSDIDVSAMNGMLDKEVEEMNPLSENVCVEQESGGSVAASDRSSLSSQEDNTSSAKSNGFGEPTGSFDVRASATDEMLDKEVEESKPVSENLCVEHESDSSVTAGRSSPSYQDDNTSSAKQQPSVSAIDVLVDSSSQSDSLEANWGSVSGISTQSDAPAVANVEALPNVEDKANTEKRVTVSKGHHSESDTFEAPSFMTLVEPLNAGQRTDSSEVQTAQTFQQQERAAWFPSLAHVTNDSPGRKKNEEIIARVTNWSSGKQQTPLKNLLGEANPGNKAKSPKHENAVPTRKEESFGKDGSAVATATNPDLNLKSPAAYQPTKVETPKEWNSPARYPAAINREKKKLKGKPYWAQFVCCSSVN